MSASTRFGSADSGLHATERAPAFGAVRRPRLRRRRTLLLLLAVLTALVVIAVDIALTVTDFGRAPAPEGAVAPVSEPARAAQAWITENVPHGAKVLVPTDMSPGLLREGAFLTDVVTYDRSAGGPMIASALLGGWRDLDFFVGPTLTRPTSPASLTGAQALRNSVVVAAFGRGDSRIEIRRVVAQGATLAAAADRNASAARLRTGRELARNEAVRMSDADRELVRNGSVDERIVTVLAALAAGGDVTVADFPVIEGEQSGPRRQVAISDVGGVALASGDELNGSAVDLITGLRERFAPERSRAQDSSLLLTYSLWVDDAFD